LHHTALGLYRFLPEGAILCLARNRNKNRPRTFRVADCRILVVIVTAVHDMMLARIGYLA
jgi:hypothetical protein